MQKMKRSKFLLRFSIKNLIQNIMIKKILNYVKSSLIAYVLLILFIRFMWIKEPLENSLYIVIGFFALYYGGMIYDISKKK